MRINKISIKNFRQFKGENIVAFEDQSADAKNIDIFVGENGAGKTTLLSALHFAFHGEILESLQAPERVAHMDVFEELQDGEETEVKVEIEFEHAGDSYALQRLLKIRKHGLREQRIQEELTLINLADGKLITPASRWINSWFPPNLAKFFFFPGEQLDHFFEDSKFDRFVDDIKAISGLDKVNLTISAGQRVLEKLQKRIAAIPGDAEATKLIGFIDGISGQLETSRKLAANARGALQKAQAERATIRDYLAKKQEEVGLLAELAKTDLALAELERDRESILTEAAKLMKESSWVPFTSGHSKQALEKVQKFASEGLLDSSWSKDLIRELIDQGRCVCGSELHKGSPSRETLESLVKSKKTLQSPQRYDTLRRAINLGVLSIQSFLQQWDDVQDRSLKVAEMIEVKTAERSRLASQTISESKDAYLSEQLTRISELESVMASLEEADAEAKARVEDLEKKLLEHNQALANAEAAKGQHGVLIRQHSALFRVLSSIEHDSAQVGESLRRDIQEELNANLPAIYHFDNVTISVDANFKIQLNKHGAPFPEAQGQQTARAFSLVLALNKIASKKSAESQLNLNSSHQPEFPMVIDAGFGELGVEFMRQIVSWLKESNSQVILMLLHKDAADVLKILGQMGGAKEPFILHMYKEPAAKNVSVELQGRVIEVTTFNSKTNETVIESNAK
jgi:DNA sulfur modification protein DndD